MEEVLDDLQSRFIINIPQEELYHIERISFQIEQSHWFYQDFILPHHSNFLSYTLKNFSALMFTHCPLLDAWKGGHEKAYQHFLEYKFKVPVCGAILLNTDLSRVLLVRGFSKGSSWSFARGKINKDESELCCAIREVYEEIGYDITPMVNENAYIEKSINENRVRLYIVPGVDESTHFKTQTRNEIGAIEWFSIKALPGWDSMAEKKSKFFMVKPFVPFLKKWIQKYKKSDGRNTLEIQVFQSTTEYESDVEVRESESDYPSILTKSVSPLRRTDEEKEIYSNLAKFTNSSSPLQSVTRDNSQADKLKHMLGINLQSDSLQDTSMQILDRPETSFGNRTPLKFYQESEDDVSILPTQSIVQKSSITKHKKSRRKTNETQKEFVVTSILKRQPLPKDLNGISTTKRSVNPLLQFKFNMERIISAYDNSIAQINQ